MDKELYLLFLMLWNSLTSTITDTDSVVFCSTEFMKHYHGASETVLPAIVGASNNVHLFSTLLS